MEKRFLSFQFAKNPSDILRRAWRFRRNGVNSAVSVPDGKNPPLRSDGKFLGRTLRGDIPPRNHPGSPVSSPEPQISVSAGARPPAHPASVALPISISPGAGGKFSLLPALLFCCDGNKFLQRFVPWRSLKNLPNLTAKNSYCSACFQVFTSPDLFTPVI